MDAELPAATKTVLRALGELDTVVGGPGVDIAEVRARAVELAAGTDVAADIPPQVGSYAGLEQHAWDLREAGLVEIMTGGAAPNSEFGEAHTVGRYRLRISPDGRRTLDSGPE